MLPEGRFLERIIQLRQELGRSLQDEREETHIEGKRDSGHDDSFDGLYASLGRPSDRLFSRYSHSSFPTALLLRCLNVNLLRVHEDDHQTENVRSS